MPEGASSAERVGDAAPTRRRLVVGGGRAPGFPEGEPNDISLNISPAARPRILGTIVRAPFRAGAFHTVYFERVPFMAFTGRHVTALAESARMLQPGGRLIIETGARAPVEEIVSAARAAGFTEVNIARSGLIRIDAVYGGA